RLGQTIFRHELQARAKRAISFGYRRPGIGNFGCEVVTFWNHPQYWKPGDRFYLLHGANSVVQKLKPVGYGTTANHAQHQRYNNRTREVWRRWSTREVRLVDYKHVGGADTAGNIDFLVTLEQIGVEVAIGVHLTLVDIVLYASILQIKEILLINLNSLF